MMKYGYREGPRVVPGIAPSRDPPIPYPGYTPPRPHRHTSLLHRVLTAASARLNIAVGLRSVDQLSLSTQISGFRGMTEVYNLAKAGNPNDHYVIAGND